MGKEVTYRPTDRGRKAMCRNRKRDYIGGISVLLLLLLFSSV